MTCIISFHVCRIPEIAVTGKMADFLVKVHKFA